ncbi:Brix-domain-containing protein [Morchella conica CCBAS932]|uniref:Brix-domain-containing protein n=1 Tax=Morchella conica CCBAS932 TaxID=1392247 RepID=A0A3N4KVI2_9PEZI|nr:Brix-domain-containing protein [Morchella conica CCBAS932]
MASVYKSVSKTGTKAPKDEEGTKKNKQRVLVLTSRGVTYRHRHLLNDLVAMLPHGRKDAKLDTKSKLYHLNEIADLYNCNNVLFFEARKRQDLYMWMSKAPNGPCIKLHVQNLHTMEELHFTGNALKGSRPILSFDATFDRTPAMKLIKEVLLHVFGVPKGARKSKPFIDHVLSFTIADGKIWFRNYQVSEVEAPKKTDDTDAADKPKSKKSSEQTELSLVEIGPRFVMTPIIILEGSFGGPVIYENKEFVSPNAVRSEIRKKKAQRYNSRTEEKQRLETKRGELGLEPGRPKGELDESVLFA